MNPVARTVKVGVPQAAGPAAVAGGVHESHMTGQPVRIFRPSTGSSQSSTLYLSAQTTGSPCPLHTPVVTVVVVDVDVIMEADVEVLVAVLCEVEVALVVLCVSEVVVEDVVAVLDVVLDAEAVECDVEVVEAVLGEVDVVVLDVVAVVREVEVVVAVLCDVEVVLAVLGVVLDVVAVEADVEVVVVVVHPAGSAGQLSV